MFCLVFSDREIDAMHKYWAKPTPTKCERQGLEMLSLCQTGNILLAFHQTVE
jgi:hypothetical protein